MYVNLKYMHARAHTHIHTFTYTLSVQVVLNVECTMIRDKLHCAVETKQEVTNLYRISKDTIINTKEVIHTQYFKANICNSK
jgi:hypothetical protein